MMHWIPYKEGDIDIPENVPLLIQRKGCVPIPMYHVVKFAKDLFKVDEYDFFDRKGVSGFYILFNRKGVSRFYVVDVEWGYMQIHDVIAYAVIDEYMPASEETEEKPLNNYIIRTDEEEEKIRKWCRANCFPGPLCPDTYCIEARKCALGKEEK